MVAALGIQGAGLSQAENQANLDFGVLYAQYAALNACRPSVTSPARHGIGFNLSEALLQETHQVTAVRQLGW